MVEGLADTRVPGMLSVSPLRSSDRGPLPHAERTARLREDRICASSTGTVM
jgi:hypothetical protein